MIIMVQQDNLVTINEVLIIQSGSNWAQKSNCDDKKSAYRFETTSENRT